MAESYMPSSAFRNTLDEDLLTTRFTWNTTASDVEVDLSENIRCYADQSSATSSLKVRKSALRCIQRVIEAWAHTIESAAAQNPPVFPTVAQLQDAAYAAVGPVSTKAKGADCVEQDVARCFKTGLGDVVDGNVKRVAERIEEAASKVYLKLHAQIEEQDEVEKDGRAFKSVSVIQPGHPGYDCVVPHFTLSSPGVYREMHEKAYESPSQHESTEDKSQRVDVAGGNSFGWAPINATVTSNVAEDTGSLKRKRTDEAGNVEDEPTLKRVKGKGKSKMNADVDDGDDPPRIATTSNTAPKSAPASSFAGGPSSKPKKPHGNEGSTQVPWLADEEEFVAGLLAAHGGISKEYGWVQLTRDLNEEFQNRPMPDPKNPGAVIQRGERTREGVRHHKANKELAAEGKLSRMTKGHEKAKE